MITRLLAAALLCTLLACGTSDSTNAACTNRVCGDYCYTPCPTGSGTTNGTTCQPVQGICDARGQCRTAFDPKSTDPDACRQCNGQSCVLF